jgi:hypothetical protein
MVEPDADVSYQSGEEFEEESQITKKITRNHDHWVYIAVILSVCFISAGVVATVLLLTKPSSDNTSAYAPRNSVSEKTTSPRTLHVRHHSNGIPAVRSRR